MSLSFIGLPDEETLSCQDGLYENHYYIDLRGMWTWESFPRALQFEDELLALQDQGFDLDGDDAVEELPDNELWFLGLDPGTASTVVALVCVGAVPFSSCNGGGPQHYETHPLVVCWVPDEAVYALLVKVGEEVGVNVDPLSHAFGSKGIIIWHESDVSRMRAFAERLAELAQG